MRTTGFTFLGAVIAAVAASLCCILPVVAVVAGITGFAASEFFAQWRPYFLGLTFGLLAAGLYTVYWRRGKACEPGAVCERPSVGNRSRTVLWLVTILVAGLAAFPHYSDPVARALAGDGRAVPAASGDSTAHVVLAVEGMDCGGCAALLERNLLQVPGVLHARVDFHSKQARVEYNPRQVDPSRFNQVINEAGFKVASPSPQSQL